MKVFVSFAHQLSSRLEAKDFVSEMCDPDIRPPSPPPTYDATGRRTNDRDFYGVLFSRY
jgi:hypothetical protein